MDISFLEKLVPLLAASRVQSFKNKEFSITFREDPRAKLSSQDAHLAASPAPFNPLVPPDLKADDTMSYDQILNWSATPDPGESEQLPLTGDAPLEGASQ